MAGGRQERTGSPADRGGPHLKGRNEEKELSLRLSLRHAAAGLEGSDAHPARSMPEARSNPATLVTDWTDQIGYSSDRSPG